MKVYKSFAENRWPYFNSFPLKKADVNLENILGTIYFYMLNLKFKKWQLLPEIMVSILSSPHGGKKTFSTLQSNASKTSKFQRKNIIASY